MQTTNKQIFVFEITSKCNLACKYCYNVWLQNQEYEKGDLDLATFKKILNQLIKDTEIYAIALAGGEPLLNKEILQIAKYAREKNIRVIIASNGTLFSAELISDFVKIQIRDFVISMPSLSAEKFQKLTEKQNLSALKKSLIMLRKLNCNIALAFTATNLNLTEIEKVFKFAQVLGVTELQINRFCPGGRGLQHEKELRISNSELEQFLIKINQLADNQTLKTVITITCEPCIFEHKKFPNLKFGKCECGLRKWTIDWNGNLRVCEQDEKIVENLLENSFFQIIQNKYVAEFNSNNLKKECEKCMDYKICRGGCRFAR
jgi:radical SAM protein with 4Fe4S-binding SPASM domain